MSRLLTFANAVAITLALWIVLAATALAQDPADVAGPAGESGLLVDIVKASGHNVLTAAVGVVAVLTLLIGKRVGDWGRGGLIATAAVVTLVAVAITHWGTQDALAFERERVKLDADRQVSALRHEHDEKLLELTNDLEREKIKARVALALDASLDDCLDTLKQLQGMTQAIEVHARVDRLGAEAVAVEIGLTLGDIVRQSGCARPDPDHV